MKDILYEWNPWWTAKYEFNGVHRNKTDEILNWISRREIIAIFGVRRSGKTTILNEIISTTLSNNQLLPRNILFIKADDDRVKKTDLIDDAIDEYKKQMNPYSRIFVFIDEIQEIDGWETILKRKYDLNKEIKFFVSGSNASIFQENLSSVLAGRCAYFEVFPFSFSEFLHSKEIEFNDEKSQAMNKGAIRHFLTKYLQEGSFPEVILEEREQIKKELVRFYFDSIFYRDIIRRRAIRNPAKMENLVKFFLQNTSNYINFTKTARMLDLTTDSVVEYSKFLEDAYLIFQVSLFDYSVKKQIINPKKIYCVDTGIRNSVGFNFSADMGRLYENTVFLSLRRKKKEIYYWKGHGECDFIVKNGRQVEAIQVCYDIKAAKERELAGLTEAMARFKLSHGLIITDNFAATESVNGKKIEYVPLWLWLIQTELNSSDTPAHHKGKPSKRLVQRDK